MSSRVTPPHFSQSARRGWSPRHRCPRIRPARHLTAARIADRLQDGTMDATDGYKTVLCCGPSPCSRVTRVAPLRACSAAVSP